MAGATTIVPAIKGGPWDASWARVRRTDNDDCSTSRMTSSFSAAASPINTTPDEYG